MSVHEKYHHGRTPAAWTATVIAAIGSIIGVVGFLLNINWMLVWVGVGVMVASAIVGGVMVKLGFGQELVEVED